MRDKLMRLFGVEDGYVHTPCSGHRYVSWRCIPHAWQAHCLRRIAGWAARRQRRLDAAHMRNHSRL